VRRPEGGRFSGEKEEGVLTQAAAERSLDESGKPSTAVSLDLDSGGTFTDAVVGTDHGPVGVKVLSTPHDLTICFRQAIAKAADAVRLDVQELLGTVAVIRFSTTVGTNAIIERRGPRLGLLVAQADAAAVRALPQDRLPGALIDRIEAVPASSSADEVLRGVERLLGASVDRIVVVASDGATGAARESERALRATIAAHYPRHILGAVPLLLSTDVAGEDAFPRRLATGLLNAYLHPALEHFLYETENILAADHYPRPLLVFGNDGTSNRVAKVTALRTYNSGPSGGVEAVTAFARRYRLEHLVGVDIGGTSTDLSFVTAGQPEDQDCGVIGGTEVSLRMRRVDAFGGGGGTIARVRDGAIVVGPHSAGSAPGPAGYGFGGVEPTVTDAAIALGRIAPDAVLAGEIPIDVDRARQAIRERLAEPLGLSVEHAALEVLNTLERAIAHRIAEGAAQRGWELDAVTLIAFGGAGPGHAASIATCAGIPRVLVPADAGVLSALGIGFSDVEHRYEQRVADDPRVIEDARHELERRARLDMSGEGFAGERVELDWQASDADGDEDGAILRLRARSRLPHIEFAERVAMSDVAEPSGSRPVVWDDDGPRSTPTHDRDELVARGGRVTGPAIVGGDLLTLAVAPGWDLEVDRYGQFCLTAGAEVRA
jgi:N-methylhydantoinase A